jgi:chaperone modulatory protein CbpM
MSKKNLLVVTEVHIEEQPELTLMELCSTCEVSPEFIQHLIEHGVIDLDDISELEKYKFGTQELRRVRTVVHLQRDLDVNLPGAALALDLLDELEELRSRLAVLEKQFR